MKEVFDMNLITWDKNDVQAHVDQLDLALSATNLTSNIQNVDYDEILTDVAIMALKMKLMGEYHGILVVRQEEYLVDSEIYLMSLDEVVEGGSMEKVTGIMLEEVLTSETFGA